MGFLLWVNGWEKERETSLLFILQRKIIASIGVRVYPPSEEVKIAR
jgi:hypothetical protein